MSQAAAGERRADAKVPILLDRVSKWYGSVIGVNEATFEVRGGIVALLGPNGAGKSTLMKLMTGQLRPSIGRVRVFGRSVRSPAARRRIGYCPDVDAFYEEMNGREFVRSMLRLSGYDARDAAHRTERALETVGMTDRADRTLRGCSKGMRQRIKLAQAIAHDPDLLILDEPLSGLDPVGRRDFCQLLTRLAREGKTLLISSHVMEEVETLAEGVILVGGGRVLAQGSWKEVALYLNHLPQLVRISGDEVRDVAGRLLQWPGVVRVEFKGQRDCLVTTSDAGGLCDRISELVRVEGFIVDRLRAESNWAEVLFGLAREA